MEKVHEPATFVSARVVERIKENPYLASSILEALRDNPTNNEQEQKEIIAKHGNEGHALYSFLGMVIKDRELYLSIEVSDAAIKEASNRPQQQINVRTLKDGPYAAEHAEKLTQSNRANELLAMARIAIAESNLEQNTAIDPIEKAY